MEKEDKPIHEAGSWPELGDALRKDLGDALRKELDRFLEMFHSRSSANRDAIGRITQCHLIIEHYLAEYVERLLPGIGEIGRLRLSFSKLLALARGMTHPGATIDGIATEIKTLNEIRNSLAHDLNFQIGEYPGLEIFRAFLRKGGKLNEERLKNPIEVIERFTLKAVVVLTLGPILQERLTTVEEELHESEKSLWGTLARIEKEVL